MDNDVKPTGFEKIDRYELLYRQQELKMQMKLLNKNLMLVRRELKRREKIKDENEKA